MNKITRNILWTMIILSGMLITINSALSLTSYVECTEQGRYWLCENGLPDPAFNFEDKGIVITGTFTFSSSSGTGTSPDAENIVLTYDVYNGFEFRNAHVTISSGSGARPSSKRDGGEGGDISLTITAPKIKMYNSSITYNTGNGAEGYAVDDCDSQEGGDSGTLIVRLNSSYIEGTNSNITVNLGYGGDADSKSCSYNGSTGGSGGNGGDVYLYYGINNQSTHSYVNYSVTLNGGNGGDANAHAHGDGEGDCRVGGRPSGYYMYMYGTSTASDLDITSSSANAGLTDCSGDDDDAAGGAGQPFYMYFDTMNLTGSTLNVKGTNSGDSDARDGAENGVRGGKVEFEGYNFICNSSTIIATSGDGGDGDESGTVDDGARCGGGGHIFFVIDNITSQLCTYQLTNGDNGLPDGDDEGGDSGYVYFSVDNVNLFNSPITWTGKTGCTGDDSEHNSGGTGGSFIYAGDGNLTISNTTMTLQAGNGGSHYRGYGGYVVFSLNGIYEQNDSVLYFYGGNRGDDDGGSYSGYGAVIAKEVKMYNSNLTLKKGYGTSAGYQSKLIASNSSLSVFNKSYVNMIMGSTGTANTFKINGTEVYYINSTLDWTGGVETDWKTYTDYAYIVGSSVDGTMDIYNFTTSNITYHNESNTGNWSFLTNSHYETYAEYFSRIYSTVITYVSSLPWKNEHYNCTSGYVLGNSSVNVSILWYLNDTYATSGVNWSGTLNDHDNLTCKVILNSTEFEKQKNDTVTIVEAYPYNYTIYIGNAYSSYHEEGELNNSKSVSLNVGGFNEYIQYICTGTTCTIPIYISTESNLSTINISNMTYKYGVGNTTFGIVEVPFELTSDTSGIVIVDDPVWGYKSKIQDPLKIGIHFNDNGTKINTDYERWITVFYSLFNVSLPFNIDFYDVFPLWPSQKDVEPFGQTSTVPIYNITSNSSHDMEIRMRFVNGTVPSCVNITFNTNNTNAPGIMLNSSYQEIITNLSSNSSQGLWSWVDFNSCSYDDIVTFYPDFYWKARCLSCVETPNFWDYDYLNES